MQQPPRGRRHGQSKCRGRGHDFTQLDSQSETGGKLESDQCISAQHWCSRKPTGTAAVVPRGQAQPSVQYRQRHPSYTEISVVSYNVLAQCYIEEMAGLYQHCPEQFRAWHYRRDLIIQQLEINKPDIICLQEVQCDHYRYLSRQLQRLDYGGHYKQRTGGKRDGCATFYKREKFICANAVPVEYHIPGSRLLNRDNVALLLVLSPRHLASNNFICVANTHLLYNPKRGDVRLAQLMFLLAAIDELAAQTRDDPQPAYDPVILCGDFNCRPDSDLYSFLIEGKLEYNRAGIQTMSGQLEEVRGNHLVVDFLPEDLDVTFQCQFSNLTSYRQQRQRKSNKNRNGRQNCAGNLYRNRSGYITHKFNFQSAYSSDSGLFTAWLPICRGGATVDYICYSCDASSRRERLELLGVLNLPTVSDVRIEAGLPNERRPSDHLMLMATFALKVVKV